MGCSLKSLVGVGCWPRSEAIVLGLRVYPDNELVMGYFLLRSRAVKPGMNKQKTHQIQTLLYQKRFTKGCEMSN